MSEDEKEIDKALEENIQLGRMEHAGFKNGVDMYKMTDKGTKDAEEQLKNSPENIMFLLSLNKTEEDFFKSFKMIAKLLGMGDISEFGDRLKNLEHWSFEGLEIIPRSLVLKLIKEYQEKL